MDIDVEIDLIKIMLERDSLPIASGFYINVHVTAKMHCRHSAKGHYITTNNVTKEINLA